MSAPTLPRRGFLRGLGLVSLPLIGGGVTLIGKPAAPVPLLQAAAAPMLSDPRERARYAWEAFSAAMREITAEANGQGWHVMGGEVSALGNVHANPPWVRPQIIYRVAGTEPRCPRLVVDRHDDIDLGGAS